MDPRQLPKPNFRCRSAVKFDTVKTLNRPTTVGNRSGYSSNMLSFDGKGFVSHLV
jgi:hypothetical protein